MEFIHVLNRGVDKRKIFLDKQDHLRFIHDLFEFNDQDSADTASYAFRRKTPISDVGRPKIRKQRKLLVDIVAFCLMPNHYHLLITPKIENGVAFFMKKLNGGYSKYFNTRYERSGALFQGKYKRIIIENEAHFIHLPYYIHFNPLDLIAPEWRKGTLQDSKKAIEFLEAYRWSSHLDYLGKNNFPSITNRELLLGFFGGQKNYEASMKKWLEEIPIEKIGENVLE